MNSGTEVRLRAYPYPTRPKGLFDILTVAGRVRPLALDPSTYECKPSCLFEMDSA